MNDRRFDRDRPTAVMRRDWELWESEVGSLLARYQALVRREPPLPPGVNSCLFGG